MVCLRHCGRHRRNREDDHRVAARRDERTVLARGDRRPRNEGPFPRIPEKEVALTLFKVDLKNGVRDSHLHSSESRFHSIFTGGPKLKYNTVLGDQRWRTFASSSRRLSGNTRAIRTRCRSRRRAFVRPSTTSWGGTISSDATCLPRTAASGIS